MYKTSSILAVLAVVILTASGVSAATIGFETAPPGLFLVPSVTEIEVHPYLQQSGLERLHAEHGSETQAWSPIGGIPWYRGLV